MNPPDRLQEDLDFVSAAVRRGDDDRGYPALYFLWAVLIGVGFALPDFAPRYALGFWIVSGLGGGLFSWWYASRRAHAEGIRDPRLGRRYAWHWLLSGVALGLVMMLGLGGAIPPRAMAALLLAVIGLTYALAGVHLNPPMLPAGLIMLFAAFAMPLPGMPSMWTFTGAAVAIALAVAGIFAARAR